MKAAVFYQAADLRVLDIPKPTPKTGEVLLKVKACGICGTDVHIYHGDEGAAATPAGTVLGHEFAGIVEAVGEGVTRGTSDTAFSPSTTCSRAQIVTFLYRMYAK